MQHIISILSILLRCNPITHFSSQDLSSVTSVRLNSSGWLWHLRRHYQGIVKQKKYVNNPKVKMVTLCEPRKTKNAKVWTECRISEHRGSLPHQMIAEQPAANESRLRSSPPPAFPQPACLPPALPPSLSPLADWIFGTHNLWWGWASDGRWWAAKARSPPPIR